MRLAALVQRLVMNQSRLRPERHRLAVAERPLAAVAIARAHVAVDVQAPSVPRPVGPRAMHQIGAPQGQVAGLEHEVDGIVRRQAGVGQHLVVHRRAEYDGRAVEAEVAARVAARDDPHRPGFRRVRVDRDPGLDVGPAEVAIGLGRTAEAAVLVPGEVAHRPRRLPVDLVDDLLEVGPDQGTKQLRDPPVEPDRVQFVLVVGRPLHHPYRLAAAVVGGDVVEQIAVPEAAAVAQPLDVGWSVAAENRVSSAERSRERRNPGSEQPDIIVNAIQPLTLPPPPTTRHGAPPLI